MSGDVTQVECDAIITLINSGGMWFGGVDRAIMAVAGKTYHNQVGKAMTDDLTTLLVALQTNGTPKARPGLEDGDVIVAVGDRNFHKGKFNDVIFVVDDLERSVGDLLRTALEAAKKRSYAHVALPVLRTGVMLGAYKPEPDAQTTVSVMIDTLHQFAADNPYLDLTVTFVVYHNPEVQNLVAATIAG